MGFNEAQGPSLIFEILPAAFSKIPGGAIWCGFFFLMLSIAAITSGMSLLEISVAFLNDQFKISRIKALLGTAVVITVFGVGSALSVANWDKLAWLKKALDKIFGAQYVSGSFFDMLDTICSNWFLPLSGLFTALFVGWVWGTRHAAKELNKGAGNIINVNLWILLSGIRHNDFSGMTLLSLWAVLIRFAVPVVIWIVFMNVVGLTQIF
jgi:NSS family neurotransmitter:Na+ symporter